MKDARIKYFLKSIKNNRPLAISKCNIMDVQTLVHISDMCSSLARGVVIFYALSTAYYSLLSSYTHSMTLTVECTHSTFKSLNVHIQWLLAIECVNSMPSH